MTTFSELQTQIRSYTETDSNVLTDTIVNDFILQAELRIFREVDLDCFRSYQFTTLSVGNEFIVLPINLDRGPKKKALSFFDDFNTPCGFII